MLLQAIQAFLLECLDILSSYNYDVWLYASIVFIGVLVAIFLVKLIINECERFVTLPMCIRGER